MKNIKHLIGILLLLLIVIQSKAGDFKLIAIQDGTSNVFEIDPNTGGTNFLFNLPFAINGFGSYADYNPADGYIYYAYSTNDNATTTVDIYKLDLVNKTAVRSKQFTGLVGAGASMTSISFTPNGDLFLYAEQPAFTPGNLYKIKWSTGSVTNLGSTGTPTITGIAYDSARNAIWAIEGFNGNLLEISPTNAATRIWTSPYSSYFTGVNPKLLPNGNLFFYQGSNFYFYDLSNKQVTNSFSSPVNWSFAVIPTAPNIRIDKAVYLDSANLVVGTNYQLQVSSDLINWTNYGAAFTATNSNWRTTNYWDVANWNQLFFRFQQQ